MPASLSKTASQLAIIREKVVFLVSAASNTYTLFLMSDITADIYVKKIPLPHASIK